MSFQDMFLLVMVVCVEYSCLLSNKQSLDGCVDENWTKACWDVEVRLLLSNSVDIAARDVLSK